MKHACVTKKGRGGMRGEGGGTQTVGSPHLLHANGKTRQKSAVAMPNAPWAKHQMVIGLAASRNCEKYSLV